MEVCKVYITFSFFVGCSDGVWLKGQNCCESQKTCWTHVAVRNDGNMMQWKYYR